MALFVETAKISHNWGWSTKLFAQRPRLRLGYLCPALERAELIALHEAFEPSDTSGAAAVHFHMSERRAALAEAADIGSGEWIWSMTDSVLKQWL